MLSVITQANNEMFEAMQEEDGMYKTLLELMQPEIDKAVAKAREEAIAEGAMKGMERGMEQGAQKGQAKAIQGVVGRLLARGGYSEEDIADIAGTTVENVREIEAGLRATA